MLNKKVLFNRTVVGIAIAVFMLALVVCNIVFTRYNSTSQDCFGFVTGRMITSALIALITACCIVEMRRALGEERIAKCFNLPIYVFAVASAPVYYMFGVVGLALLLLVLFASALVIGCITKNVKSFLYFAFLIVYPGLTMLSLITVNRCVGTVADISSVMLEYTEQNVIVAMGLAENSTTVFLPYNALGLALILAVSSFTDVFAYLFGSMLGKHKLCPAISPNKTVEGAVFGLLGGLTGSALVFLLFDFGHIYNIPFLQPFGAHFGLYFGGVSKWQVYLFYVAVGILGAVVTQIGDLVASFVKRKCGIKDYGKILGPHGGIMDRFDGIMMNSLFVSVVFTFII